jgi:hypothetical protein
MGSDLPVGDPGANPGLRPADSVLHRVRTSIQIKQPVIYISLEA